MADAQPFNTFGRRRAVPRVDVRRAGIGALPPPQHQQDLCAIGAFPLQVEYTLRLNNDKLKSISYGLIFRRTKLPLVILRTK